MRNVPCPVCEASVDPLLAPMIVVDGRVVAVCRDCAWAAESGSAAPRRAMTELEQVATPSESAPDVETVAAVEAVAEVEVEDHAALSVAASLEAVPERLVPTPSAQVRRRKRKVTLAAVASVAALAVAGVWVWHTGPATGMAASIAQSEFEEGDGLSVSTLERQITSEPGTSLGGWELTTAKITPKRKYRFGDDWVYPLPGIKKWRTTALGSFGARRPGKRPRECRRGHCGVDLHGPRGMPVVSILPGRVVHIGRVPWRRSGRYVRVQHDNGLVSSYMHLDRIQRKLKRNQRIRAGQQVGTLGRTGIKTSPPHLHFSVSWKKKHGRYYFNPARALGRSKVIERPRSRRK